MIWKPKMEQEDHNMKKVCDVCGWEYDEAEGYPEGGIAPRMILSARSAAQARMSSATLTERRTRCKR